MMNISFTLDLLTRLVHGMRPLWKEAGNIETALLANRLREITIEKPVFITGLARAGSTLLLEYIAAHRGVATHQYRDFPFIFTPYFSRIITALLSNNKIEAKERAHGDGIFISPQSPEGMEEMLWLAFAENGRKFSAFYQDHIKKLLLVTNSKRYAAKNNNLSLRLSRLLELFPDARIIVPIRDPLQHISSLLRQHERFMAQKNNPRIIRHMKAQGHFEFGPTYQPKSENMLNNYIEDWNNSYRAIAGHITNQNLLCIPYESLCAEPEKWLEKINKHAMLESDKEITAHFAKRISRPDYYKINLSPEETALIKAGTEQTFKILTNNT